MKNKGTFQELLLAAEVGKKAIEGIIGREISWDEDIEKLLSEKEKELISQSNKKEKEE